VPCLAILCKFYKAVVQSVLLYSSKIWNLLTTALTRLERFHINAVYQMAKKHKPKKRLHHGWVYPHAILLECSMGTILHYIDIRRALIFRHVVNRPIYAVCKEGEWRRGFPPRQWWWEQKMSQDHKDKNRANE
jgi:hypothetical protein